MVYKVFFEIYGKKMVAEVEASSEEGAQNIVRNKIKFHKIEKTDKNEFIDELFSGIKDTPFKDIFK